MLVPVLAVVIVHWAFFLFGYELWGFGAFASQFTVRPSIFRASLGLWDQLIVAIHIYPFVPLLHPTSQISSKRVLATPFALLAKVAYRIALPVCCRAKSGGLPVGSISLGRAQVRVQIEAAALQLCLRCIALANCILFPSVFGFHYVSMNTVSPYLTHATDGLVRSNNRAL
jgi:hypothetical protein